MASLKQIEANRRNAQNSTGPSSEEGKRRASRNAVRHGLTAETVIEPLEDPEDYKAFEEAIAADFRGETAVERELVLRLASLLWRLRRAISIETGLLQMDHDVAEWPWPARPKEADFGDAHLPSVYVVGEISPRTRSSASNIPIDLARRFLGSAPLDRGALERLNRYEMVLWRQVRQTLFTLEALRARRPYVRYRGPEHGLR